jgi:hypothetical protein
MERKGFLGGSDAKRILDGEWFQLWQEKTGRVEPEDLSHQFNVQLGIHTERFHIDWLCKYHGFNIERRSSARAHRQLPWMKASLDGWCTTNDTFVEVKHSRHGVSRDYMADWYQPQIAHYCNVVGKDEGWLSYIAGNQAPDFFNMKPSHAYLNALLEAEKAFWWHVENDHAPDMGNEGSELIGRAVLASKEVMIDDMRVVDMTGNNEWASMASEYLATKQLAAAFDQAKTALKKLVEEDVRIASGHGVMIKRNKAGNLAITESKS